MSYLEIKNIEKKFKETEVLKNISFTLDKSEVLSIIGLSGSGKTTLLRIINGLEIKDKGNIFLDSKEVCTKETINANNFGLVFQQFNLFPQYTVLENVTLAMNIKAKKELKNKKLKYFERKSKYNDIIRQNKEKALEILSKVDMLEKKDNYPCELSGGQMQRVAIARALALYPKVLCFDEPTSALDPLLTKEVLNVIKSLKEKEKITMIIVTHEIQFAKEISDKIIFMSDGVVKEMGSPEEIFNNPKTEELRKFIKSDIEK